MNEKDNFYLSQEEPNQSCLLSLRHILITHDVGMSETVKYGLPCFLYKSKILCYLNVDKRTNEPYILWANGRFLDFLELELGDRTRMKILRVIPQIDLPIDLITKVQIDAINLQRQKDQKSNKYI